MARSVSINALVSLLLLLHVFVADFAPIEESEIDKNKPWHDLVVRRFFGPWTFLYNKNGDYIDYADYDGHIEESEQVIDSSDSSYEPSSESNGYTGEVALSYDEILPEFGSIYSLSPVGLAVFRTGIPSGRIPDTQPPAEVKNPAEEIKSSLEEVRNTPEVGEEVTNTPKEEETTSQPEEETGN